MSRYQHFETRAIRAQIDNSLHREHAAPIFMTSSFVFDEAEQGRLMFADELEGNIYTRFSNPNTSEFIDKMCLLEETEDGMATASGMSAVYSSMAAFLETGDHILTARAVFGSTHQILTQIFPKWGIEHTYADLDKPEEWEKLIKPNTKMIFVETPSNPGLDLVDLEWLGGLANKHGIILNVDNCFATPYLQQPIKYGAHIITHSATKFIDGQGRSIGGIVLGSKELIQKVRFFARHTGPAMSPFNAWILSKSLETLSIRMEKHCDSALRIAQYLDGHPELETVKYPFLESHPDYELAKKQMKYGGGLLTFTVKGGYDRAKAFLDKLEMLSLTANLGDSRTTVTHPASMTHSKLTEEERRKVSIYPGMVRISVGLENVNDILEDIEEGLKASASISQVTVG